MAYDIQLINPTSAVATVPLYRSETTLLSAYKHAVSPDFFVHKGWLVTNGTLTAVEVPEIKAYNFWHNGIFYTQESSSADTYSISTDGITWSEQSTFLNVNDMFAMSDTRVLSPSSNDSTAPWKHSANGIDWTLITVPTGYQTYVKKVAGTVQTIYTTSSSGHNIAISTDLGLNWTIGALPGKTTLGVSSAAYVAGLYSVSSNNDGTSKIYVATSPDGITWTSRTAALNKSTATNTLFVSGTTLVMHKYNWNEIHRSLDGGVTWSTVALITWASSMYITGTRLIAVKYGDTNLMYSDNDGATWNNSLTPPDNAKTTELLFSGDFAISTFLGSIQVSYNRGYSWIALPKKIIYTPVEDLFAYTQRCDNGMYVHAMLIGAQMVLIESANGIDWVPKGNYVNIDSTSSSSAYFSTVGATYTYHAGTNTSVYIIYTKYERFFISYDNGQTWTQHTIPNSRQWINNASSIDGKIAVMHQSGHVYCGVVTALNTITWTERSGLVSAGYTYNPYMFVYATAADFVFCYPVNGYQYNQNEIRMNVTNGVTVVNADGFAYKANNRVKIRYNTSNILEASFDGTSWVSYGSDKLRAALSQNQQHYAIKYTYAPETPIFLIRNEDTGKDTIFTTYSAVEINIPTDDTVNSIFYRAPFFSLNKQVSCNYSVYSMSSIEIAGSSWRRTDTYGANYDMAVQNESVVSCTDEGLHISQDNGATWAFHAVNDLYTYAVTVGPPGVFVAVGDYNPGSGWRAYAAKSTDYGVTWAFHMMHNGSPYASSFSVFYNGIVYCAIAAGNGVGLLLSTDGVTWTQKNDISETGDANFGYLGCANGNRLFVFGWNNGGRYIYSDDNGATWTAVVNTNLVKPYPHSFDGNLYIFDDLNSNLWRSTDNGITFDSVLDATHNTEYYGSYWRQCVARTNDAFFLFDNNSPAYFTSADGINWVKVVNDGRTLDNFAGPSVGSGTRIIRGDQDAPDIEYGLIKNYPFWTDLINCEDV